MNKYNYFFSVLAIGLFTLIAFHYTNQQDPLKISEVNNLQENNLAMFSFSPIDSKHTNIEDIDSHQAEMFEKFSFNIPKDPRKHPSYYWDIVYSIESNQGKYLFRKRNRSRNCTWTTSPCGHHQLTVRALKDIGCTKLQCRKDRLNFSKSLEMSKELLALNEQRMAKHGYYNLDDYQKYLIHQQGATGLRIIISADKGNKALPKSLKRNMANNSPYSYKSLSAMNDKSAARKFLKHWENKWDSQKELLAKKELNEFNKIPLFDESEIKLALNYRF